MDPNSKTPQEQRRSQSNFIFIVEYEEPINNGVFLSEEENNINKMTGPKWAHNLCGLLTRIFFLSKTCLSDPDTSIRPSHIQT